jgi:hypothetical protein
LLAEALYLLQIKLTNEKVVGFIPELTRAALRHFEQQEEYQKMTRLLQLVPILPDYLDEELLHLRNRAYIYEMRRVQRFRRYLYGYLALQAVLILIVFPLLFINAENGAIANAIEDATEAEMPAEPRQFLSYADGVYWSVITAASIGYGDITPVTRVGKIIAATLGTMGVITISILAGLILYQLTPKQTPDNCRWLTAASGGWATGWLKVSLPDPPLTIPDSHVTIRPDSKQVEV